ncbi:retropepsin-like aspartic peptidase RloA2 [Phytopseudomonas dryadis]|uniref:ATP-dependent zinc protease n=1 Tax=Phytopseudomonas dryadis TaxID=2487520 RepID=A0A4Q9R1L9_9GAMM|nr:MULTISPECIES: ATP-dependent zinc protease [Pseudomonas]TBU92878.1 ATP-dependent zinc protease [Pseudomonas dryadis]TBV04622.1 ATP-dependent zinc protease [Pseudomonas dryadis]TBV17290.1 ATP-dependent zinc protease [Pseudomonas sp. FRB 230]
MKTVLALLAAIVTLPAMANQPTLYGRYEYIGLPQIGQTLKAKMDTGAMTASLSARDIEHFERDGEDWVRFRLAIEEADEQVFEKPLARITEIKNRAEEGGSDAPSFARRPVVDMDICLGEEVRTIEVNLTDRSHFDYPLLIGASALRELEAAIDPANRYTAARPQC